MSKKALLQKIRTQGRKITDTGLVEEWVLDGRKYTLLYDRREVLVEMRTDQGDSYNMRSLE